MFRLLVSGLSDSPVGSLILLFCLVFAGLILWPDPHALIRALTSEEILFAVQLSLLTSLVSTTLCAVIALPVAYALSRYRFPTSGFMGLVISLPKAGGQIQWTSWWGLLLAPSENPNMWC